MAVFGLMERLTPEMERKVKEVLTTESSVSSRLRRIQGVLQVAEREMAMGGLKADDSIKELEEVMYEMKDVLDEWEIHQNEQWDEESTEEDDSSNLSEKVRSAVFSLCSCFQYYLVSRRRVVATSAKIISLSQRIDEILEDIIRDKNTAPAAGHSAAGVVELGQFQKHISLLQESWIIGRGEELDMLLRKLFSDEVGHYKYEDTPVISIIGMGGLGKTTLAKLIYNHPKVKRHFQLRAWVTVSDPFGALSIGKAILQGFEDWSFSDTNSFEAIQSRIKLIVSQKKRFLLILDDVWTENPLDWEPLERCLSGSPESKIIVTTRSESSARVMGTTHYFQLPLLRDEDCWCVMRRIALSDRSMPEFEKIGRTITRKCYGLPLAAKILGTLLASKVTVSEWLDVQRSPSWGYDFEYGAPNITRCLMLSYLDLDLLLRQCFLSCAIICTGDSAIHLDKMLRVWMAHGYLRSSGNAGEVEEKGQEYFQMLVMRGFLDILETKITGVTSFTMHDLVRDFAFYIDDMSWRKPYVSTSYSSTEIWTDYNSMGRIRTFFAKNASKEHRLLDFSYFKLERVEVLIVSNCNLEEVPEYVGELIHLRYLDLSHNPILQLPETVSDLYYLQTLDLENCWKLTSLPRRIKKLINLRHLLTSNTPSLVQYPQGLQFLNNLWALNEFRAGKNSGKLGILRNLNQLRGSLRLIIEGVDEEEDVYEANLREKIHIKNLDLSFHSVRREVIEALQPPPQLQTLRIVSQLVPQWITSNPSLAGLQSLVLAGRGGTTPDAGFDALPPLGTMPFLEELQVSGMGFKRMTRDFLGIQQLDAAGGSSSSSGADPVKVGFPSLKELKFENCDFWEEWEDIEGEAPLLPSLRKLSFSYCPMLKELPHNLLRTPSLEFLSIHYCHSLKERYDPDSGTDKDKMLAISD